MISYENRNEKFTSQHYFKPPTLGQPFWYVVRKHKGFKIFRPEKRVKAVERMQEKN